MPRVALLLSSARTIELADGGCRQTGVWAEQVLTSYDRLMSAGADVVMLTPDGEAPVIDPYSLEPAFHHPKEDRAYFASVHRTFRRHPEHIRIRLQHLTDGQLLAGRRIAHRLLLAGRTEQEAHHAVSNAARIAWQHDRGLVEVMSSAGLDGGVGEDALGEAVEELALVSRAAAQDCAERLTDLDEFRFPRALSELTDAQLAEFDGVLAPGGYAAMVDLPGHPDVTRLLDTQHGNGSPIAALCHAPAMLLAAGEQLDGRWLFDGFRFTCCTNEEEDQTAPGQQGMSWYAASALQNAGAILDDAPYPWVSHVVVDRNLITGQNWYSTVATVEAFRKAIGVD